MTNLLPALDASSSSSASSAESTTSTRTLPAGSTVQKLHNFGTPALAASTSLISGNNATSSKPIDANTQQLTRVLLVDPEKFANNILRQNRQHEREFSFDYVFKPLSTHAEVHEAITAPLVDSVVRGLSGTVFAYGPTGSGKTFTMIGTEAFPGLMTLITRSLYEKINASEYTVFISFLEIYNEIIRDLLTPRSAPLDLLEDERGAVQVPGLSRVKASNTAKIMQFLKEGNERRSQEPTAANQTSSRSHALLQITLYRRSVQHGRLFLCDLAGSERAANSMNHGKRLKEGAAINRSLLALGNVINALSSGNKGRYVNYRDSKLTRLLKDSLGGNSKTIMLAHITPASLNYDETFNTLIYASRARNITTRLVYPRPASADQVYKQRIEREMERQLASRAGANGTVSLSHAISSHQISEKGLTGGGGGAANLRRPSLADTQTAASPLRSYDQRKFSSLFNSLKAQYLVTLEKQQRLRERLLRANQQAYDIELDVNAKTSILQAWEMRTRDDEEKHSDTIDRLKRDLTDEETLLSRFQETRRKTEHQLRKNANTLANIEARLRAQAKDTDRSELVQMLVSMGQRDAENMALVSDAALHKQRMAKHEGSLQRLQRYDQLADRLISNNELPEQERKQLINEYRAARTQLNLHLVPLKSKDNVISWNTIALGGTKKASERVHLPAVGSSSARSKEPPIETPVDIFNRTYSKAAAVSTSRSNVPKHLPVITASSAG